MTIHIALFYFTLFLILAYLVFSQKLASFIKRPSLIVLSESVSKKAFYIISVVCPILLILMLYISFLQLGGFWVYAVLTFFAIPVCLAFFWPVKIFKQGKTPLKKFAVAVFAFSFIGLAGSNLHDLFWCYDITDGFSKIKFGGEDLLLWTTVFKVEPSYNTFGIYMTVEALLFFCCGLVLLYYQFGDQANFRKILFASIAYAILLGLILYFIDMPDKFGKIAYAGIPALALALAML